MAIRNDIRRPAVDRVREVSRAEQGRNVVKLAQGAKQSVEMNWGEPLDIEVRGAPRRVYLRLAKAGGVEEHTGELERAYALTVTNMAADSVSSPSGTRFTLTAGLLMASQAPTGPLTARVYVEPKRYGDPGELWGELKIESPSKPIQLEGKVVDLTAARAPKSVSLPRGEKLTVVVPRGASADLRIGSRSWNSIVPGGVTGRHLPDGKAAMTIDPSAPEIAGCFKEGRARLSFGEPLFKGYSLEVTVAQPTGDATGSRDESVFER